MGAGNFKQVSPTQCRWPFDKTSFGLQRKTRGAKCNGRASPGNGHTRPALQCIETCSKCSNCFTTWAPCLSPVFTTSLRSENQKTKWTKGWRRNRFFLRRLWICVMWRQFYSAANVLLGSKEREEPALQTTTESHWSRPTCQHPHHVSLSLSSDPLFGPIFAKFSRVWVNSVGVATVFG